jgi:hypothetical protein
MEEVARQLQRSASVGIGFAIACDEIKNESSLAKREKAIDKPMTD